MTQTAKIRRWSDAKLDKEFVFGRAADDGSPESRAWINAISAEVERRAAIAKAEGRS